MESGSVERLAAALERALQPGGWRPCRLGRAQQPTEFCRPLGRGLVLVVRVLVMPVPGRGRRPRASVTIGMGLSAAMDLAPVLALPVTTGVVFRLDPDGPPRDAPVVINDVNGAARQIAARAAVAFDELVIRFRDETDLLDAARAAAASKQSKAVQLALFAAAVGRVDDAHTLLLDASSEARHRGGHPRREIARTQRLARWDSAGQPPPPPFEDTLRRLPPPPPLPPFCWSDVKHTARQRLRARATVARRAKGHTVGELAALLSPEYDRRGVTVAPAVLFAEATQLQRQRAWVGRAFEAVKMIRAAAAHLHTVARGARDTDPPPAWRRLPDTAASPARSGGGHTLVRLDPDSARSLATHLSDDTPFLLLTVWLTLDRDGRTGVHVGPTEIGQLEYLAAARYRPDLIAAAELYDEQVTASGMMFAAADGVVRLQLRLPPG